MTCNSRALALGFFDGVHIGHKALLELVNQRAKEHSMIPSVLNFDIHPDNLLCSNTTSLIYDNEKRREIFLREFGISDIILLHFDVQMMQTEWDVFLDFLIREYHVRWLVAGYDFRFGYRGSGTTEMLLKYCRENGIGCDIVQPVVKDGEIVRSSLIRKYIQNGDMKRANDFLGRPYSIEGVVCRGYHVGTEIGYPTINIMIPEQQIIPHFGVYATITSLNGKRYPSITNVGVRPTFSTSDIISIETHILEFHELLYDCKVEISFYGFIRDEIRFSDASALTGQIETDIETAKKILAG